jgi:hypothetical protein
VNTRWKALLFENNTAVLIVDATKPLPVPCAEAINPAVRLTR